MTFIKRMLNLLLLALVVAALAALALADNALAAEVDDFTVSQTLQALSVLPPNGQDAAMFDRAACARMLVQSSAARNTVSAAGSISPFADVSFRHPAAGYIRAASRAGYMSAAADGKFRPEEAVEAGAAVRGLLALLGYGREQYALDSWQFAASLGLLEGLDIHAAQKLSQQQANRLFYNALCAVNAGGRTQIEVLGFSLQNGVIDMQGIIAGVAEGPVTLTSANANWYAAAGLKTESLTVYRNDSLSSLFSLQLYDVIYYHAGMNTAWAYSDKVSGVFKAALPSRLSPVSINISGMDYALSQSAALKLASFAIEYGETVILLLGPDGKAADILRQGELVFDVVGFATAADKFVGTDSDGKEYNGYTITLITVDGSVLTYEVKRDYSSLVGKLVKLSNNNGETGVTARQAANLRGKVDAANLLLGDTKLAQDIRIMEVYGNGAYDITYLSRLDGVSIGEGKVLHYTKNSQGAVSAMFISGVTGDLLQYGIITEVSENRPVVSTDENGRQSSSGQLSGNYSYIINGNSSSSSVSGAVLHAQKGPAALGFKNGKLDSVKALEKLSKVTLYEAGYVLDGAGERYMLAGAVSIYQRAAGGEYKLLSLKQALELNTTFTAYYDKPEGDGGRIRLLIAD
ncbi:MAG: S-layer homology domain-containing protein [Clostridiales bacterium]|nr:S-layer homology domain-containing protein [Clostridiales bacterium]